jgi:hypothetical protein
LAGGLLRQASRGIPHAGKPRLSLRLRKLRQLTPVPRLFRKLLLAKTPALLLTNEGCELRFN